MIGLKVKKKRFTLLYLEENELYVQDLTGSCTFYDFTANQRKYAFDFSAYFRTEKGKLHICSKSLIFEPNNLNINIQKYLYREMKTKPKRSIIIYSNNF
jgi:factor associated with neutral sphingomyelinase activation